MAVEQNVIERIENLIATGQQLRRGNEYDQIRSEAHREQCVGWFAPAQNVVQIVCPSPDNAYRKRAEEIVKPNRGLTVQRGVGELTDLLSNLLTDIQLGLLSSVVDRVRAEAFD